MTMPLITGILESIFAPATPAVPIAAAAVIAACSLGLIKRRGARRLAVRPRTAAAKGPSCGKCGNALMLRTRSGGAKEFYGCASFPSCKGVRGE